MVSESKNTERELKNSRRPEEQGRSEFLWCWTAGGLQSFVVFSLIQGLFLCTALLSLVVKQVLKTSGKKCAGNFKSLRIKQRKMAFNL